MKMVSRYILRLDDASSYFSKRKWMYVEQMLEEMDVIPIVGIVAKNKDPEIMHDPYNPLFWDNVRRWEKKGWVLGLHGETHELKNSGKGLVPVNNYSEFEGLSLNEQCIKLRRAIKIWKENELQPNVWVAPAHSFDNNTLIALKKETKIRIISDGFALFPYRYKDFLWIPQQLWRYRNFPIGIWTICIHPNLNTIEELKQIGAQILKRKRKFINAIELRKCNRNKNIIDTLFSGIFVKLLNVKIIMNKEVRKKK